MMLLALMILRGPLSFIVMIQVASYRQRPAVREGDLTPAREVLTERGTFFSPNH